jgi:hypothetical protein
MLGQPREIGAEKVQERHDALMDQTGCNDGSLSGSATSSFAIPYRQVRVYFDQGSSHEKYYPDDDKRITILKTTKLKWSRQG